MKIFKPNGGVTNPISTVSTMTTPYHMYPFRYIKEEFNNVPKETFLKALNAEGIPCSNGYGKQNKDGLIEEQLSSRGYRRLFNDSRLNQWREKNVLPGNA